MIIIIQVVIKAIAKTSIQAQNTWHSSTQIQNAKCSSINDLKPRTLLSQTSATPMIGLDHFVMSNINFSIIPSKIIFRIIIFRINLITIFKIIIFKIIKIAYSWCSPSNNTSCLPTCFQSSIIQISSYCLLL